MATALQSKNIGLLLIGILLIIGGIYVLFNPLAALIASALFIGIALVLVGVGYLFLYTQDKSYLTLSLGILDIFIGLVFLSNIGISAATMPIIFALWILFIGISQLAMGLELKKLTPVSSSAWKWWTASGLFGILFAILVFIFPTIGALSITILLGIYLIEYGAFELNRYLNGY